MVVLFFAPTLPCMATSDCFAPAGVWTGGAASRTAAPWASSRAWLDGLVLVRLDSRVDSVRFGGCGAYEAPSREEFRRDEGGLATFVVSWSLRATFERAACWDADSGLAVLCVWDSDLAKGAEAAVVGGLEVVDEVR